MACINSSLKADISCVYISGVNNDISLEFCHLFNFHYIYYYVSHPFCSCSCLSLNNLNTHRHTVTPTSKRPPLDSFSICLPPLSPLNLNWRNPNMTMNCNNKCAGDWVNIVATDGTMSSYDITEICNTKCSGIHTHII